MCDAFSVSGLKEEKLIKKCSPVTPFTETPTDTIIERLKCVQSDENSISAIHFVIIIYCVTALEHFVSKQKDGSRRPLTVSTQESLARSQYSVYERVELSRRVHRLEHTPTLYRDTNFTSM